MAVQRLVRLALFLVATVVAVVGLIEAGLAWFYVQTFTHLGCAGARTSLADQGFPSEAVEIPTPRGYVLRGWLTAGRRHPGVVVLVLPGGSGNTDHALPDAALLAQAGYGTLVVEHRSCADAQQMHSGGYLEAEDVVSAAAYLRGRAEVQHIGVLGFSTGGSAALLAAAAEPRLEAVLAGGGFVSLTAEVLQAEAPGNPADWLERRLILLAFGWQLGVPADAVSPVAHIAAISPRPLLLVYGEFEAGHGQTLYAAAGDPKELWIVPGVGHGGYQAAYPEEYAARITGFFDQTLGAAP